MAPVFYLISILVYQQFTEFLLAQDTAPVIDIRPARQYRQGHITNSSSLPFEIDLKHLRSRWSGPGTVDSVLPFIRNGKDMYQKLKLLANENDQLWIYCHSGGLRSYYLDLLNKNWSFPLAFLEGGYEAYRASQIGIFRPPVNLFVLSGKTGNGKTETLHFLAARGAQVIDLEGLACHRGSVLGKYASQEQPTNEQFQNDLAYHWSKLDPARPVFVEREGDYIGKVALPGELLQLIRNGRNIHLEAPLSDRVGYLLRQYPDLDQADVAAAIRRVAKKMPEDWQAQTLDCLYRGDLPALAAQLLLYYDQGKSYQLSNPPVFVRQPGKIDPAGIAQQILSMVGK